MQECGRILSVKLTERECQRKRGAERIICVAERKIQLCVSNCVKQMLCHHL